MRSLTIADLIGDRVLLVGDGYRTKRAELAPRGYRILRVAEVLNDEVRLEGQDFVGVEHQRAIGLKAAQGGDVLLTTKGTVGRVAIMPETCERVVYSPQLCFFRVIDPMQLDRRWLSYWFRSADFRRQASHRKDNTDMAAYINLFDIRSLTISLPPLDEQRGVAEVLGALDDKIAANRRVLEVVEQLAVILARSSVTAPLSEVARLAKRTVDPASFGAAQVGHFSLPAFDIGSGPEMVTGTSIKSNKTQIEGNTVLVSKLNPRFPRIWDVVASGDARPALASTEFLALSSPDVSSSVLWAVLSDQRFARALEAKVAGTSGSHQRVRPADVLATEISDPRALPMEVRETVTELGRLRHSLSEESMCLARTRDALLPLLMSGKVTVKDAEKTVEEVL